METSTSTRNPLITIAAIAVILFSGVGVATMLGWIPSSHSKSAEAESGGTATPLVAPAGVASVPAAPPGEVATAPMPAAPMSPQHHHHKLPAQYAEAGSPPPSAAGLPPPADAGAPPAGSAPLAAQAPACYDCGTVQSVQQIEHQGQGTGLGAVAGGVLGAVVGHQVGQGNGNTLATLIGAGGGALAGNTVEKNTRKTLSWKVNVAMADGSTRSFNFSTAPAFAAGDHVRVNNGQLLSAAN